MIIPRGSVSGVRNFWQWLNIVWNRVDQKRIQDVGPDRACAEWLMRNGACVKWKDFPAYTAHYDDLPPEGEKHVIVDVDGTDASITYMGFPYFEGCNYVERIRFHHCTYLDDAAMQNMKYVKNSLECLQISDNGNITDAGVTALGILSKLNSLVLLDLPAVKNKDNCVVVLQKCLPNCKIEFDAKK